MASIRPWPNSTDVGEGAFWTGVQGGRRWGRGPLPGAVGGPFWDLRRFKPAGWVPARSRAGIQAFSRESPDAKSRGGMPPAPPRLSGHSLLARSALALGGAARRLRDYYGTHVRTLIWRLSFAKCFFSIFFRKNASQIGFRISVVIAPPPYQIQRSQKPASGNERP